MAPGVCGFKPAGCGPYGSHCGEWVPSRKSCGCGPAVVGLGGRTSAGATGKGSAAHDPQGAPRVLSCCSGRWAGRSAAQSLGPRGRGASCGLWADALSAWETALVPAGPLPTASGRTDALPDQAARPVCASDRLVPRPQGLVAQGPACPPPQSAPESPKSSGPRPLCSLGSSGKAPLQQRASPGTPQACTGQASSWTQSPGAPQEWAGAGGPGAAPSLLIPPRGKEKGTAGVGGPGGAARDPSTTLPLHESRAPCGAGARTLSPPASSGLGPGSVLTPETRLVQHGVRAAWPRRGRRARPAPGLSPCVRGGTPQMGGPQPAVLEADPGRGEPTWVLTGGRRRALSGVSSKGSDPTGAGSGATASSPSSD